MRAQPVRPLSFFLCLVGLALPAVSARADELQKLRSKGGELFYLDTDLRAAYGKAYPTGLPEARRRLPGPKAVSFDWMALASRPYSYTQKVTPYCWAFASVSSV